MNLPKNFKLNRVIPSQNVFRALNASWSVDIVVIDNLSTCFVLQAWLKFPIGTLDYWDLYMTLPDYSYIRERNVQRNVEVVFCEKYDSIVNWDKWIFMSIGIRWLGAFRNRRLSVFKRGWVDIQGGLEGHSFLWVGESRRLHTNINFS